MPESHRPVDCPRLEPPRLAEESELGGDPRPPPAADVGYYAVPRTGDTAAIAAEIDCKPSTAGELLRKAEGGWLPSTSTEGNRIVDRERYAE